MKKVVSVFTVKNNQQLNSSNFHINLQANESLEHIRPGQFTNVEIPFNKDVFLRRPFSIFKVDYENNCLTILVKILGKGSKTLSEIKEGSKLNLIYPLGNGFTLPGSDEKILAVGGGSGVAPILHLVEYAKTFPSHAQIVLGARNSVDHISNIYEYSRFAELHYTTDDGSLGHHGVVTQHPVFGNITQFDRIYACGPLPMMKAVAEIARKNNITCEVSLENLMACGFGVCLCCIEPTIKGNLCVCTEGPVFNINDLKW